MEAAQAPLLSLIELNTDSPSSIVLVHGAFHNSTGWDDTALYLNDYHLLIPDLPGHGRSRQAWPSFSVAIAADAIAEIVRQKGKNSRARLVGLSLGAHVVQACLTKYPDIVEHDAILLGLNCWPEINTSVMAHLGWLGTRIGNIFPESRESIEFKRTADGTVLPPMPLSYWKEVCTVITSRPVFQPWSARTLIVAAGKNGGAPVTDRAVTARKLRDAGCEGNTETVAYWNDDLIHAWPVLQGKLCADTILAWAERKSFPQGFTLL